MGDCFQTLSPSQNIWTLIETIVISFYQNLDSQKLQAWVTWWELLTPKTIKDHFVEQIFAKNKLENLFEKLFD